MKCTTWKRHFMRSEEPNFTAHFTAAHLTDYHAAHIANACFKKLETFFLLSCFYQVKVLPGPC